jgi:regulatory protein
MDIFDNIPSEESNEGKLHKKAYLYAIRLLARRDYSRQKLYTKLSDQGYEKPLINKLLDELIEVGYLREDQYASARIKGFMFKGYSISYIQQKLAQENVGVEMSLIEEIFEEYSYSHRSQLEYLLEKKTRSKTRAELVDFNFRKKLLRYFISKGHSINDGNKAIERAIRAVEDETDH